MTCYETLRAPAPAADAPMAHHFVKWWRNKFRSGYKKFSVGTESERTDTEELVCRAASQCSAPPDLLPSEARALLQPAPPAIPAPHACPSPRSQENKQPRLRFEELTCDVELKHSEPSKQQPLQFSFTLYDLDGHGRMTKDDIAGIVSTIYESIGKSVTVPHYGSKTIQVRLTVVPDDGSSRKEARDARRQRRRKAPAPNTAPPAPPADCVDGSDEERRSRLSLEDDASSCSSENRVVRPPVHPPRPPRHTRREPRPRKHTKKRSGSLQRRELLEIIQANMEKNHLSFQTTRKPYERVVNEEEITNKYQKLRNRAYSVSEKPTNTFQKAKTECSGNGYLDLAAERGGDSNLCRYDRYLHAVICSSARHATTGYHHRQPRAPRPRAHARSRSHDVPPVPHTPSQAAPHSPRTRLAPPSHPRVLQIIFL